MDNEYNLNQMIIRLTGELRSTELAVVQATNRLDRERQILEQRVVEAQNKAHQLKFDLDGAKQRLVNLIVQREENPPEVELARRALASNNAPLMRQRIEQLKACGAVLSARYKGQALDEKEMHRVFGIRNSWYDLRQQMEQRAISLEAIAAEKQKEAERIAAEKLEREEARGAARIIRDFEQRVKANEKNNS